ncbi:MAG: hypothetical protein LBS56_00160 [Propionibacteriaceae bacterium]|nr:hypothetical protein [Propionibacteriaceae bacterium]
MAASAYASCTDTSFTYEWGIFSGTQRTTVRYKDNTSSMYMYANSVPSGKSYTAYATGYSNGSYVDVSRGHLYQFVSGSTPRTLVNWVREDGYTYASIAATKDTTLGFTASGVWSPDYC